MIRRTLLALVLLAACLGSPRGVASDPQDALRLVPDTAVVVLRIDHPRQILDRLEGHFKQLGLDRFDEVNEFMQSTPVLRLRQFLTHLELAFGRPWPKLLDDLTDGGITLALTPGKEAKDARVLGIARARDAQLLERVYDAALAVMKNEAGQADAPLKVQTAMHRGVTTTSFGDGFHLARQGQFVLFANKAPILRAALDRLHEASGRSILDHPRFKLDERPTESATLAWGWVDLVPLKAAGGAELEKLKLPTNEIIPQLVFGGLFDAYLRSDQAWFALTDDGSGPALQITTPAGREKSHEGSRQLHMHDPKQPGILPLLSPPGTLYSTSFYWDLAALYNQRKAIYKQDALKEFEDGEKKVKPFLAGNSLGQLFNLLGARHRVVVARPRESVYTIKPKSPYPSFALVAECRNPEKFYQAISVPLRGAGFFLSTQVNMKLVDQTHAGCKIVGYRFVENEKNRQIGQGTLFNYTPCFTRVGQYVVFSSSLELCRDLIDELQRTPTEGKDNADIRHRFSWSALGEVLATERALVATELTLRHGGAVDQVDRQITNLLQLLDKLGTVEASVSHSPHFKLEVRARYRSETPASTAR